MDHEKSLHKLCILEVNYHWLPKLHWLHKWNTSNNDCHVCLFITHKNKFEELGHSHILSSFTRISKLSPSLSVFALIDANNRLNSISLNRNVLSSPTDKEKHQSNFQVPRKYCLTNNCVVSTSLIPAVVLPHWGWDKRTAAISQTTFWDTLTWIKIDQPRLT